MTAVRNDQGVITHFDLVENDFLQSYFKVRPWYEGVARQLEVAYKPDGTLDWVGLGMDKDARNKMYAKSRFTWKMSPFRTFKGYQ